MRFFVTEGDSSFLGRDDAMIGDRHLKHIRGEVVQCRLGGPDALTVDVPVDLPDLWRDELKEARGFHTVTELRAEDCRERLDWQKKAEARGMPLLMVDRERPAWHDIVDMGMVVQLPSPGVEYTEEAGGVGAEELGIGGEGFQGTRGCREECAIADTLMRTEKRPQRLRHGEGQHEMVTGQLPLELFFKPLVGVAVLASWTVPITAGAVNGMRLPTGIALIDDGSRVFGATVDHGADHLAVLGSAWFPRSARYRWGRRCGRCH